MNWIQDLQKSIDYMEAHLMSDINYDDISDHLHMSSFHFHRTFSLITGMSAKDYIRKRRLSIAAELLVTSDIKIIDLAYDLFYQTPESFSKAFSRFHGITPSQAKKAGTALKSFNKLYVSLQVKGGQGMDYRIEEQNSFKVLAQTRAFKNGIINEEGNTEIPDFWTETINSGGLKKLHSYTETHDTYGICFPVSEEAKTFDYGIGVLWDREEIPEGYEVWEIKPSSWAVFECIGEDGGCIGAVWEKIFSEFLVHSPYDMIESADYELYLDQPKTGVFCEVWLPVQLKK